MSALLVSGLKKALGGRAVLEDISFTVEKGRVLGLVGESGAGKTTLARCLVRLVQPDAGAVAIEGREFLALSGESLREARRKIQFIFQDPSSSLDPRRRARDLVAEGLDAHGIPRADRVEKLFAQLSLPEAALNKLPHQLSGGQSQRVAIARALALEPAVLIADEPTSALDVVNQKALLELLRAQVRERNLALLFISHDLSAVQSIADDVAVLDVGRIAAVQPVAEFFAKPLNDRAAQWVSRHRELSL